MMHDAVNLRQLWERNLSDNGQTDGTARTLAFRCPADLESHLTKAAADLGVSVSRAIDGLLRDGIDARASTKTAQRLEGAITRLEFLAQRVSGRNQFDDESTLVGFAMLEAERGESELVGLVNYEAFYDRAHRSAWRTLLTLPQFLSEMAPDRSSTDVPDILSRLAYDADHAPFLVIGGVHRYFETALLRARRLERGPPDRRRQIADAIRGVVGEVLQQFVDPDPHHAANFAKAREVSLSNLAGAPGVRTGKSKIKRNVKPHIRPRRPGKT